VTSAPALVCNFAVEPTVNPVPVIVNVWLPVPSPVRAFVGDTEDITGA